MKVLFIIFASLIIAGAKQPPSFKRFSMAKTLKAGPSMVQKNGMSKMAS